MAALGLALVLAALIYGTAEPRERLSPPERWLRDGLAPVQAWLAKGLAAVGRLGSAMLSSGQLVEENRELRARLETLRASAARAEDLERQVRELRAALGLREQLAYHSLAADVIARPRGNWVSTLVLNRGEADGVQPGLAVIAPGGVAGQIRTVTARTSTVLLLTDTRSAVGGRVDRSGDLVLVEGTGEATGQLLVRALTADARFEPGDQVLTSGLGQVFPEGLLIGEIEDVKTGPQGSSTSGSLRPAADLGRLDVVFIILDRPGPRQPAPGEAGARAPEPVPASGQGLAKGERP